MSSTGAMLGMSLHTFTLVHVVISLIGIASGLAVLYGLIGGKALPRSTALFLATTVATSATGFGFPVEHLLPSHVVGILSLVVLGAALAARYALHLRGAWRHVYVITAVLALYLNVFVLVVQLFRRVPFLNALAPTQAEPPFAIAQGIVLLAFVALTVVAVRGFRAAAAPRA
jgi:hypothetical protein